MYFQPNSHTTILTYIQQYIEISTSAEREFKRVVKEGINF